MLASFCLMGGLRNSEVWENYWRYQKLVSSCCEVLPGREDTMDKHDSPCATRLEKGHLVLRAASKLHWVSWSLSSELGWFPMASLPWAVMALRASLFSAGPSHSDSHQWRYLPHIVGFLCWRWISFVSLRAIYWGHERLTKEWQTNHCLSVLFLEATADSQLLELVLTPFPCDSSISMRRGYQNMAWGHLVPCCATQSLRQQANDIFPDVLNQWACSSLCVFPTHSHKRTNHNFMFFRQGFMYSRLALNWLQIHVWPWTSNSPASLFLWDYRYVTPCPVYVVLGFEPRASCIRDKHSTNWATFSKPVICCCICL